jgi:hypothetical protein
MLHSPFTVLYVIFPGSWSTAVDPTLGITVLQDDLMGDMNTILPFNYHRNISTCWSMACTIVEFGLNHLPWLVSYGLTPPVSWEHQQSWILGKVCLPNVPSCSWLCSNLPARDLCLWIWHLWNTAQCIGFLEALLICKTKKRK